MYVDFGHFYEFIGENKKAEELYLKAIDINPANSWLYVDLGQLYEKQQRFDEALNIYQKALKINPGNDRVAGAYALLCKNSVKEHITYTIVIVLNCKKIISC